MNEVTPYIPTNGAKVVINVSTDGTITPENTDVIGNPSATKFFTDTYFYFNY